MSEASEVIDLAAPYITYVFTAVLLFSIFTVAEHLIGFLFGLFNHLKGRVVFK